MEEEVEVISGEEPMRGETMVEVDNNKGDNLEELVTMREVWVNNNLTKPVRTSLERIYGNWEVTR